MQLRRYRFEVVTQRADGVRHLVSRHHERGRADRRLIRLALQPGQIVEILDDGKAVRVSRFPDGAEAAEIPF